MGTLWHGGTIYTLRREEEKVEAVYVEDGMICEVGAKRDLQIKFAGSIEQEVDLHEGVMVPGFIDSHLHMIGHGEKLIRVDLSDALSVSEVKKRIAEKIGQTSEGEWVIGEGWNENNFPDQKILQRSELDELAPNHPLMLTRICRHAILANSYALDLAGVDKHTPEPQGGVIVREDDGTPSGYLLDHAQELVRRVIPAVSEQFLQKALTTAVDDMLSRGLVGGHTEDLNYYGGFERTLDTFFKVIDGQKRKFRTNLLVHHGVVTDMHEQGYTHGPSTNRFLSFGAMKIFADGALGGRTALLSEPYTDDPQTNGVAIHTPRQLSAFVKKARSFQMPVAIHTIGDLALELALDVFEAHPPKQGQRDRIIHAQVLRDDLLARLQALPVSIDIQPRFVVSDFPWVEERLGARRLASSFAWRTMLTHGIHCAGGSDAPIEPVDPLLGIHAAVTRRKPGETHEGYLPAEKLSVYEAVQLFTQGSAYAIGKEQEYGYISPGYVADFTVLDRDIFLIEPDEMLRVNVEKTVVDDTVMYERTSVKPEND